MSLLDKIKKHGVSESLDIARQHAVDAANNAVFRLCKCFPINPNRIVLESGGGPVRQRLRSLRGAAPQRQP